MRSWRSRNRTLLLRRGGGRSEAGRRGTVTTRGYEAGAAAFGAEAAAPGTDLVKHARKGATGSMEMGEERIRPRLKVALSKGAGLVVKFLPHSSGRRTCGVRGVM